MQIKSARDVPYELYESCFQTGSSIICNPPVTNTDIDFMFYTKDMEKFNMYLLERGWEIGGSVDFNNSNWLSYKKNNLNFLLTDDIDHYDKFEQATKLATKLNLLKKEQRIILFNYIVDGEQID